MVKPERGRDLEESRMRIPVRHQFPNRRQAARYVFLRDHFAIDPDSLAERDEMRRGEKSGPVACGAAEGIEQRTDGAFAIRARDVDDAFVRRRKPSP